MYGWKTAGECEAKTNLVNISASILRFEVEDFSCRGYVRKEKNAIINS